MNDIYYTIEREGEARYTEKMSRFLAFAVPVTDAVQAKDVVKQYQNKYHDARHVCWAYMLGPERKEWQLNDNGEPSGTAGKPILGQINSAGLTDVLVLVVRYFGGIKLGTSGLIAAYREAARLALEDAGKVECRQMREIVCTFPYPAVGAVMKIIKSSPAKVIMQSMDNTCILRLQVALDDAPSLTGRLADVDGTSVDIDS